MHHTQTPPARIMMRSAPPESSVSVRLCSSARPVGEDSTVGEGSICDSFLFFLQLSALGLGLRLGLYSRLMKKSVVFIQYCWSLSLLQKTHCFCHHQHQQFDGQPFFICYNPHWSGRTPFQFLHYSLSEVKVNSICVACSVWCWISRHS